MKVLLINPPAENYINMEMERDIVEGMGEYPPLGLLYLAATAELEPDVSVRIIDAPAEKIGPRELKARIASDPPGILGVTAMTANIVDALLTARAAKEISPEILTIIGGHHPSLYPELTARQAGVDYIMAGEAELSFRDLIRALGQGLEPGGIPGLGYIGKAGEFVFTPPREIADLDSLPFPNRRLTGKNRYTCTLGAWPQVATVMSSRGCPFRCTFCYSPSKHYRLRSVENLMAELKLISDSGIREVFFFDDLFNINENRVLELCGAIMDSGLKLDWSFRGRIKPLSDRVLAAARRAGCSRIQFGIETGTQKGLDTVNKGITLDEISDAVRRVRKRGILAVGSFMIGLPGETREEILQTFRFAAGLGLNYIQYAVLLPYPFTRVYKDALERGLIENDFWEELARDPVNNRARFRLRVWEENLSEAELMRLVDMGYRSFYLRPRFLLQSLLTTRSLNEFGKKIKGALTLFKP